MWFFHNHRLPVALAAMRRGYRVSVAAPADGYSEAVARHGIAVHDLPMARGVSIGTELPALLHMARTIRQLRPDVVHLVTVKPVTYGGIIARVLRVPAVVSAISGLGYTFVSQDRRAGLLRAAILMLYRAALRHPNQRVIFQNTFDRDTIVDAGACEPACTVLIEGSGVDVRRYARAPEVGTSIVLGARLLADKGVREFVHAAETVRARRAGCRFVLAGDVDPGNPSSITRDELDGWVRAGLVDWVGWQEDLRPVLRTATIACLPSYREGLPRFLIEAAATGLPIVTTDVPGCRNVVRDGFNGILVPARDSAALAAAITRLLDARDERVRMGRNGRRMARARFDVRNIAKHNVDLYDQLLQVT